MMGAWIFSLQKGGWCLIGNHPSGKHENNDSYLICEESMSMLLDAEQPDGVSIAHQQHVV